MNVFELDKTQLVRPEFSYLTNIKLDHEESMIGKNPSLTCSYFPPLPFTGSISIVTFKFQTKVQ